MMRSGYFDGSDASMLTSVSYLDLTRHTHTFTKKDIFTK